MTCIIPARSLSEACLLALTWSLKISRFSALRSGDRLRREAKPKHMLAMEHFMSKKCGSFTASSETLNNFGLADLQPGHQHRCPRSSCSRRLLHSRSSATDSTYARIVLEACFGLRLSLPSQSCDRPAPGLHFATCTVPYRVYVDVCFRSLTSRRTGR